jgi:sialate O-acetylesterase
MKRHGLIILTILLVACTKQSSVTFELPSIIGDNMILQRNTEVNLWGKASPHQKVQITTTWGTKKVTKADRTGQWQVKIKTTDAGGPYEIGIQTPDTSITISNVLLGEVWICSGQSNMEMPLKGWPPNDTINNSAKEIEEANYPQIRLFTFPRNITLDPSDSCMGSWSECSTQTAGSFSATAYFFGKKLYNELHIPIGLVHSSWGGTPAEAWTSAECLEGLKEYANITDSLKEAESQHDSLMAWMRNLVTLSIDGNDPDYYSRIDLKATEMANPEINDASWPVMSLPSLWETSGLPDFDGIVWFRKEFELPAAIAGKDLVLHLGPVDDMDATYINGEKIGEILKPGFWKQVREYKIPAGKIKTGRNVIAVCVIDLTGDGGIYGPDKITLSDSKSQNTILLNGDWKFMPVAEIIDNGLYLFTKEKSFTDRPKVTIPIGSGTPTVLYNGMINPIVNYTIKGVIWYQGEANVGRGYEYRTLFSSMINCWRSAWKQGDFPFYYVQIAPWEYGDEPRSAAAELREAQLMTLQLPNTGMAVIMDIGNPVNIHPSDKEDVGKRLALWALAKNYGFDSLTYSGPIYKSMKVDNNKIVVTFGYTDGGLVARGGDLTWFEIAGADQVYYPANAQIVDQTVVVSSDKVPDPVAVRYGWSATAEPNLFNTAGLPASPFRTDNWKRLSE